jgi:hypothetical protein
LSLVASLHGQDGAVGTDDKAQQRRADAAWNLLLREADNARALIELLEASLGPEIAADAALRLRARAVANARRSVAVAAPSELSPLLGAPSLAAPAAQLLPLHQQQQRRRQTLRVAYVFEDGEESLWRVAARVGAHDTTRAELLGVSARAPMKPTTQMGSVTEDESRRESSKQDLRRGCKLGLHVRLLSLPPSVALNPETLFFVLVMVMVERMFTLSTGTTIVMAVMMFRGLGSKVVRLGATVIV